MTQFYVMAQNGEENGWLQILLYIIIAAFWIIGGILKKVKDNKVTFEQETEHPQKGPPVRKAVKKQPHITPKSIEPAKAQRPKQTFAVEIPTVKSDLSQVIDKSHRLKAQPIKKVEIELDDIGKKPEAEFALIDNLNLENTDQLQKAILYSEILGKPVALRNQ